MCGALGCVSSVVYVISAGLLFNEAPQLFLIWADGIIVTTLSSLTSLIAIRRPSDFFDEFIDGV